MFLNNTHVPKSVKMSLSNIINVTHVFNNLNNKTNMNSAIKDTFKHFKNISVIFLINLHKENL